MRKKIAISLLSFAFCLTFLFGCGGSSNAAFDSVTEGLTSDSMSSGYGNYKGESYNDVVTEESMVETPEMENGSENGNVASNRKLIKTYNLNVEVEDFTSYIDEMAKEVESIGGYIESSNIDGTSITYSYKEMRYANFTIRVPKDKAANFIETVGENANVLSKSENVEDVTLTYVDMQARKDSLINQEKRLNELLLQATNLEEIIALEDKLAEVQYEIDTMESSLRAMDNLIDYTTIHLSVREVERYTEVIPQDEPYFSRMFSGFVDSCIDVWDGLVEFVLEFVIAIPYLLFVALILFIIFCVGKFVIKKTIKKINKNNELNMQMVSSNTQSGNVNPYGAFINTTQTKKAKDEEKENK